MPFNQSLMEEMNMLIRFNLDSSLEGLKVHSSAESAVIDATARLYKKGLISQQDGGYLTGLGRDAAEHAQSINVILNSP